LPEEKRKSKKKRKILINLVAEKNMSVHKYTAGLHNVGSYQVAGSPYLTASAVTTAETIFYFPRVTKRIVIENTDTTHDLNIYFLASSTTPLILPAGKTIDMDIKCAHIYMKGISDTADMQMYAEITNIPTGSMYSLVGITGV